MNYPNHRSSAEKRELSIELNAVEVKIVPGIKEYSCERCFFRVATGAYYECFKQPYTAGAECWWNTLIYTEVQGAQTDSD